MTDTDGDDKMPLQDASTNMRRSGSSLRSHRKVPSNSSNSLKSGPIPPPWGVQSMLRTTAEIGDIGQLALSNVRNARNRPQPGRYRSKSFDSTLPPSVPSSRALQLHPDYNKNRPRRQLPGTGPSRHGSVQSNLSSYRLHPQNRRRDSKILARHLRDHGNSHYHPQPLHGDRSHIHLRNHGDNRSRYSGSSSNRSAHSNILHYYGLPSEEFYVESHQHRELVPSRVRHYSSTASSPALMTVRANAFHYSLHVNPSVSSLDGRSSSAAPSTHNSIRNRRPHVRRGTPEFSSIAVCRRPPHSGMFSSRFTSMPSDRLDEPRYYDYSESFIGEQYLSPDMPLLRPKYMHGLDETLTDSRSGVSTFRAQTPFGTRLVSESFPAELPTKHNRRKSELSNKQEHSPSFDESVRSLQGHKASELVELPANDEIRETTKSIPNDPVELDATIHDKRQLSTNHRSLVSSRSGLFFLSGEKSQRDLAALAARVHSTEERATLQALAISRTPTVNTCRNEENDMPIQEKLKSKHTQWNLSPNELLSVTVKHHRSENLPLTRKQAVDVLSPRPERLMSAQSRKQFSKIIEFDSDRTPADQGSSQKSGEVSKCNIASKSEEDFKMAVTKQCPGSEPGQAVQVVSPNADAQTDEPLTPHQRVHLSTTTSHGKSTVASLLDKHIESLGLVPERDSSSDSPICTSTRRSQIQTDRNRSLVLSKTLSWPLPSRQLRLSNLSTYRSSSLNTNVRMNLKPKRLFASMDDCILALPGPLDRASYSISTVGTHLPDYPSKDWGGLPSTSHTASLVTSSRPTLTSGEMADVDTDIYPLGCKVWTLSQLSLPTSLSQSAPFSLSNRSLNRRNTSTNSSRRQTLCTRDIRVFVKPQNGSGRSDVSPSRKHFTKEPIPDYAPSLSNMPSFVENIKFDGDRSTDEKLEPECSGECSPSVPGRWSSIMAAMPMPGAGLPMFPRKISTRTKRSQTSHRSRVSLAEPLNNTRQLSQIPQLNSFIPKLTLSDFGAPLDASTLESQIPHAQVHSLCQPLMIEAKTFFDNSPLQISPSQRSKRRQYGLRPMKTTMQEARKLSALEKAGLPMRNGAPIAAVGPFTSGSMGACFESNTKQDVNQPEPIPNFPNKRRVVSKFKEWWRRQCM